MPKSDVLRVQDVRGAYRLIGECRDVGSDPALWHRRMYEGLGDLVGALVHVVEGRLRGPQLEIELVLGFSGSSRAAHTAYMRELHPSADPLFRAWRRLPGRLVTRTRRQLVPDAPYHRSVEWREFLRRWQVGDRLISTYRTSHDGTFSGIALHRPPGAREFSHREARLLELFHEELGPLIGGALVSAMEQGPDALSPRLRQTLACLLEGDSEKQLAGRLGVNYATAHTYVTKVYRHFNVTSRSKLMAHAIKRMHQPRWRLGRAQEMTTSPPELVELVAGS